MDECEKELQKKKNIEILEDTLDILKKGCYKKEGLSIRLNFSHEQMCNIQVFLPEDIESIRIANISSVINNDCSSQNICCNFSCENIDALILAQKKYQNLKDNGDMSPKILVLNMASATQPGGQTRKGAGAQEEELCRRTSLLLSLENTDAKKYYDYNNALKTHMGSDAIMLSPYVDIIKNSSSETLSQPFSVSVISCAAPMVRLGFEGMSQQEYEEMLCKRIQGILLIAASKGYRHLILGAFGCGIFGNDAAVVSDLFYRAISDFSYGGAKGHKIFQSIDFAVLCRPDNDYNYREFCRNFK